MNMKGSLPLLILHQLSSGPRHGYAIAKDIKAQSEGLLDFKEGTLYPTLHSMQKQGLIECIKQKENGRIRKYYRLTENGTAALEEERLQWQQFSSAVNSVLKSHA